MNAINYAAIYRLAARKYLAIDKQDYLARSGACEFSCAAINSASDFLHRGKSRQELLEISHNAKAHYGHLMGKNAINVWWSRLSSVSQSERFMALMFAAEFASTEKL